MCGEKRLTAGDQAGEGVDLGQALSHELVSPAGLMAKQFERLVLDFCIPMRGEKLTENRADFAGGYLFALDGGEEAVGGAITADQLLEHPVFAAGRITFPVAQKHRCRRVALGQFLHADLKQLSRCVGGELPGEQQVEFPPLAGQTGKQFERSGPVSWFCPGISYHCPDSFLNVRISQQFVQRQLPFSGMGQ